MQKMLIWFLHSGVPFPGTKLTFDHTCFQYAISEMPPCLPWCSCKLPNMPSFATEHYRNCTSSTYCTNHRSMRAWFTSKFIHTLEIALWSTSRKCPSNDPSSNHPNHELNTHECSQVLTFHCRLSLVIPLGSHFTDSLKKENHVMLP